MAKACKQTRLDFSYNVRAERLLCWASRVRYGLKSDGVEWNTQLGRQQRIAATKQKYRRFNL